MKPFVLWFTGYSGAGKTTLARAIFARLRQEGQKVELIDGDVIRSVTQHIGFDKESRINHLKQVAYWASRFEAQQVSAICSFITPFEVSRSFARTTCSNYIEVHVNTPLEVCEGRDVKGLYARARAKEIKNFTGLDGEYETPQRAEITVNTTACSVEQCVDMILAGLEQVLAKQV